MKAATADQLQRHWPRVDALLDALLERPPAERPQWLAAQSLEPEIGRLLAGLLADADGPAVLARDPLAALDDALPGAGRRLGPWRLLRPLGAGGSASVWLAERADGSYAQRVAIKILRTGVLERAERERFARERALLARLQHPAIARLLDGGLTPEGAPYLVLEYVDGLPLDRWCDSRSLSLRARIRLLIEVCAAVQYAHRHLVVHRDLKPGNILVDHEGGVRLLDFGIARLLDDASEPTETGARRLTPAYAAPEQREGAAPSTALDVYALGVLLHELLCGARPRAGASLAALAATAPPEVLAARGESQPRALSRALRGDLQAIVDTALQAQPARRYPSVEAFAADLGHHLEGRPVSVRTSARGYRIARMLRRHALAVLTLVALLATLGTAAWYSQRQAAQARMQAARAQAVQGFLVELLESAAGDGERAGAVSVPELMRLGARRAQDSFADAPATRAALLLTLGRLLHEQGQMEVALATLAAARAVERKQLGLPEGSLGTRQALALARSVGAPEAAAVELRAVLAEQARTRAPGPERAHTLEALGFIDSRAGRHAQALAQLREAVALSRGGGRHGTALLQLGDAQQRAGERAAAARSWRQALVAVPRVSVLRSRVLASVGYAHLYAGELADARTAFEEALALQQALLPAAHPYTAVTLVALGSLELESGRPELAQPWFERAAQQRERLYGPLGLESAEPLVGLGDALVRQGKPEAALPILADAVVRLRALPPEQQSMRAWAMLNHARALLHAGRPAEALAIAGEALAIQAQAHGALHEKALAAHAQFAAARAARGDREGARAQLDALIALVDARSGARLREERRKLD